MKPSEVLDSAANIILRDGWYQGNFYEPPPAVDGLAAADDEANRSAPCCQDGALQRAIWGVAYVGGHWWIDPTPQAQAYKQARAYMEQVVGDNSIDWNDHPDRTKEEVVAALRQAAENARGDGL